MVFYLSGNYILLNYEKQCVDTMRKLLKYIVESPEIFIEFIDQAHCKY